MPGHVIVAGHGHACEQSAKLRGISPPANGLYLRPALSLLAVQIARITSLAKAQVPRITVHGTRKTCGSLLTALDVHPRAAMQILRHSKIAVTMEIYHRDSLGATRVALCSNGWTRIPANGWLPWSGTGL